MAETNDTKFELHILKHLLQPSYLSATIAVLTTLIAVGSVVMSRAYLATGWLADALHTVATSNQSLFAHSTGDGSSPFNAVLLFLFWALLGLATYFMVIGMVQAVGEVRELGQEMTYVHTDRKAILLNYLERLLARFGGLALLFITTAIYLKLVLPFALWAVGTTRLTLLNLLVAVVSVFFLLLTMHLLTVLLRVIVLRPRLFTAEIEA